MPAGGRRAVAIRHVAFEDLGQLAPVMAARGVSVSYVEAQVADFAALDPAAPELVVILGGPIGAYQEREYPFLVPELRYIAARLARGLPTLGICLGCQLIARASGARVYPGGAKEIGWAPIALTAAGATSALRHLAPQRAVVLHWHGDTFDLPAGATLLASTEAYANQAFVLGRNVLGLQFHAEVTGAGLESWFVGHAAEIAATPGLTVTALRDDTARFAPVLERQGRRFLEAWLDDAGFGLGE